MSKAKIPNQSEYRNTIDSNNNILNNVKLNTIYDKLFSKEFYSRSREYNKYYSFSFRSNINEIIDKNIKSVKQLYSCNNNNKKNYYKSSNIKKTSMMFNDTKKIVDSSINSINDEVTISKIPNEFHIFKNNANNNNNVCMNLGYKNNISIKDSIMHNSSKSNEIDNKNNEIKENYKDIYNSLLSKLRIDIESYPQFIIITNNILKIISNIINNPNNKNYTSINSKSNSFINNIQSSKYSQLLLETFFFEEDIYPTGNSNNKKAIDISYTLKGGSLSEIITRYKYLKLALRKYYIN